MAELADVQDLGSCAERRVGSTPTTRTKTQDGAPRARRPFLIDRTCQNGAPVVTPYEK